jgi:hypothetical protein
MFGLGSTDQLAGEADATCWKLAAETNETRHTRATHMTSARRLRKYLTPRPAIGTSGSTSKRPVSP